MKAGGLGGIQDRASRLLNGSGDTLPPGLKIQLLALIAEAYQTGYQTSYASRYQMCEAPGRHSAHEWGGGQYWCEGLNEPVPALSDDDSEAQADAAEQRAAFRTVHFPGSGPIEMPWPGEEPGRPRALAPAMGTME